MEFAADMIFSLTEMFGGQGRGSKAGCADGSCEHEHDIGYTRQGPCFEDDRSS